MNEESVKRILLTDFFSYYPAGGALYDESGALLEINRALCEKFGVKDQHDFILNNLFDTDYLSDLQKNHLKNGRNKGMDYFVMIVIKQKLNNNMKALIGKKAPEFHASAVINGNQIVEDFSLEQYLGKKHVVMFFYPMDFTFVCPTELHAFQEKLSEFEKRDVAIVGCSVDSVYSHFAWLNQDKNKGGIHGVKYPIVADFSKTIAENYGVLAADYLTNEEGEVVATGTPVAYRALFLIDKEGKIRHYVINDLPLGRNVDEAIRMVDALQHFEEFGEVCPANWSKGKDAMKATNEGVSGYLSRH
jgi:peroxiredoxin 2/4